MAALNKSSNRGLRPLNRRKSLSTKRKVAKIKLKLLTYFSFLVVIVITGSYLLLSRNLWDGKTKLTLAINKSNNDILVITLDPEIGDMVSMTIPGETLVESARQLGFWKLKSLWKLSQNEGLKGKLLAETLVKQFNFPVLGWADSPAEGFSNPGLISIIKSAVTPYQTNLSIADKLGIAFFIARLENSKKLEVDLAETSYLIRTSLADGEEGYVASGVFPPKIMAAFADTSISRQENRVLIKDLSGTSMSVNEVGEVVEVLGAKVASIQKEDKKDIDCLVKGKDLKSVEKIAKIFSCGFQKKKLEGNFDLEIIIGESFAKRF